VFYPSLCYTDRMTTILDLKRELKPFYTAKAQPHWVDVPEMYFLMLDGHGDPNTSAAYAATVQALYALAYTLKFTLKKPPTAVEYPLMPLEGLWWVEDMRLFDVSRKADWQWTMMLSVPEVVTRDLVELARAAVLKKKPELSAAVKQIRLETYTEMMCAQVLHTGPYAAEGPTVQALHAFIAADGKQRRGKHHEIYLGDPRRADPAKLKTIIRQPVA
jgi:hypothetical protein